MRTLCNTIAASALVAAAGCSPGEITDEEERGRPHVDEAAPGESPVVPGGAGGGALLSPSCRTADDRARNGALDRGLKVRPMVLPDKFQEHDKPEKQYEEAGLNAKQIVAQALLALGAEQKAAAIRPVRA